MTDTTTTEAPALTLDADDVARIKELLAAIYWCAHRLDKDEIADDSGEPLRTIANEVEAILDLDVDLDKAGAWERAEDSANAIGLAREIEYFTMPTRIVRDAIEAADLGKAVREALNVGEE